MRSPAQPLPAASVKQRLVSVLAGEVLSPPPIWLMRQAGRYLPEYREVRASVGGFLELCYTPALAAEVTLQPIRRYGFDAAILFSDILVVPDALGQGVRFVEGEGPRLDAIGSARRVIPPRTGWRPGEKFGRVYETVARLRQDLPRETALIGFCGAPWTVATYMVGGEGSVRSGRRADRSPIAIRRLCPPHRHRHRSLDRLSRRPGARRRRRAADLRQLGRQSARWGIRRLGGGADPSNRRRAEASPPRHADHRFSARGRRQC